MPLRSLAPLRKTWRSALHIPRGPRAGAGLDAVGGAVPRAAGGSDAAAGSGVNVGAAADHSAAGRRSQRVCADAGGGAAAARPSSPYGTRATATRHTCLARRGPDRTDAHLPALLYAVVWCGAVAGGRGIQRRRDGGVMAVAPGAACGCQRASDGTAPPVVAGSDRGVGAAHRGARRRHHRHAPGGTGPAADAPARSPRGRVRRCVAGAAGGEGRLLQLLHQRGVGRDGAAGVRLRGAARAGRRR